ncbi:TPA: hypothetical protein M4Z24_004763 [Klebsiella pneumoniae]|nr:hypothetical protein [Klebsiella pneumoniae]HDK6924362.1 hypothetical protein [Klebsiella pneumoniae]
MHTDVYTLKTPLDTLSWLCLLESELLSIRAFQRLDLHTDRDEPNELTFLEDSIIGTGTAYGWFVFLLGEGDIPPLPDTSKNLLYTLDELGKEINRPFWEKAVDEGIQDARCDRAIAALERM